MISIVISIYNGERYLKRCLDSILKQENQKFELVLVNDGSKDNSLEICNRYKLKFNSCKIVDKQNGGLSSARKAGYEVSSGEYIIFIDCDDYMESNWISELYKVIEEKHPDLIIYNYNFVTDENNKENKKLNLCRGYNQTKINEKFNIPTIGKKFNDDFFIPAFLWLRCIRKDLIEEDFFISERKCYTEDILFDLLINNKIINYYYLDKELYNYCLNLESLTNRYRENMWDMMKYRFNWINNYCKKNNILDLADERLKRLMWISSLEAINNLCKSNDYKSAQKEFKTIRNSEIVFNILKIIKKQKIKLSIHEKIQYLIIKYRLFFLYYLFKRKKYNCF